MSRILKLCFALLIAPAALYAQGWPLPAKTQNTEVPCNPCPVAEKSGLLTAGYQSPIQTFTGRFLDSQNTGTFQQPFRTARAQTVMIAPQLNRVYMMVGSAVVAYNLDTFFARLASGEPMVDVTAIPVKGQSHGAPYEQFLQWDRFFYAENGSPWKTIIVDGQQKLFAFDYDDQGYVYLAYSIFGWGIVKDDGGSGGSLMTSVYQGFNAKTSQIATFKSSSGRYYAMLGGGLIYDTTDRGHPTFVRTAGYFQSVAKNSTGDIIAILDSTGQINIWRGDDLAAGGTPLKSFTAGGTGSYSLVTSDGTNFYGDAYTDSGVVVGTIRYDGVTYNQTMYPTSVRISRQPVFSSGFQYGGGYITIAGVGVGMWDLALLKMDNGVPTQVDLNNYIQRYYSKSSDANHTIPAYVNIDDGLVYKSGDKYYLIVEAGSLGDVYEIKGADSLSPSFIGCAQATNCAGGPFYGDTLTFRADASTSSPVSVQWNFGNPEAAFGADPNIPPVPTLSGTPVTHQYSGMTASSFVGARTITATNIANTAMTSFTTVTLKRPSPAFGITGTNFLFKQPDASSAAPIIVGDAFFDGSDGENAGHYSTWTLDGIATKVAPGPTNAFDVGACGNHSLVFDAHYGPYSGAGASLATIGPDYLASINPFNYTVRPFAAVVNGPNVDPANGDNVLFTSASRVIHNTTLLPSTQFTYRWKLVTTNGTGSDTINVEGPSGTADGSAIPPWSLSKQSISLYPGSRARLVLLPASAPTGACANMNFSAGYSVPLVPPPADLAITGGCTNGGPPCTYSVTSASAPNGWKYLWSASGPGVVTPATASTATYSPSFGAVGNYQINLRVSNSVGFRDVAPLPQQVTSISTCGAMNSISVFITASCGTTGQSNCPSGSSVQFGIGTWQYSLGCGDHTFNWNFDDGSPTTTGQTPTHTYTTAKSYIVTCVINNGSGTPFTARQTVVVGTVVQPPPPPPPPPPTGCGAMVANGNVFITYNGASSSCSSYNTNACNANEQITFTPGAFNYSYACANHTFTWNFGDGASASGHSADNTGSQTHSYATAGTYAVTLTINNGSSQVQTTQQVKVGGGGPPPPPPTGGGSCPTMVANGNVFVTFQNATGSCSYAGGTCVAGDAITFNASSFNYSFTCATHSFSWDFGDNHSASGSQVTHAFANAGTYNVALTIDNGSQHLTIHQPITIAQSSGATAPIFDFTITPLTINGVSNAYVFNAYSVPAGTFSSFTWNFGDGPCGPQPCSGPSVTHIFPDNQNYTITLTVPGQPNSVSKTLLTRHRAGRH